MSDAAVKPLVDQYRRPITYLRLSTTDRCDLRCTYCMPERMRFLPRAEVLSLEELEAVALGFIARGVTKIRLTGGEPLVRRDIMALVRSLGRRLGGGLRELTLTTNGTQLADHADDLFAAGVRRINVSLDTLDAAVFARLSRRDALTQVLRGIDAAQRAGLKVKINAVALKGVNEADLPSLIAWAHARACEVTLIEVMPLGDVDEDRVDHYLPLTAVREALEQRWTLIPSAHRTGGPARFFEVAETGGRLGLITPLTNNFCESCNRVRVTATGQLYACLGGHERVDLRHHFAIDRRGAAPALPRHMSATGG